MITEAGGHQIKTVHDLPRLVDASPVGNTLSLKILRNGKQQTLEATIGEMPKKMAAAEESGEQLASALGMRFEPLTPPLHGQLRVPKDVNGVVGQIANDSPANALGIEPGDVIESIDQKPVTPPRRRLRN